MSEELRKDEDFAVVPAHREALSVLPDYPPLSNKADKVGDKEKRKRGGAFVRREKSQKIPRIHIAPGVYMPR